MEYYWARCRACDGLTGIIADNPERKRELRGFFSQAVEDMDYIERHGTEALPTYCPIKKDKKNGEGSVVS